MVNLFSVIIGLICLFTPVKISSKRILPKNKAKILGTFWILAGGLGYISQLFILPDAGLLGDLAIVLYGVSIILTLYFVISTKGGDQLTNEPLKIDRQQKIVNYLMFIVIIGFIIGFYSFLN